MLVEAPISIGMLIINITILEIKQKNIRHADKLRNIDHELTILDAKVAQLLDESETEKLQPLKASLKSINEKLWYIEDRIRDCERENNFGPTFIELARSVYFTNDQRAQVKKDINEQYGSELVEEKSYQSYS